MNPDWSPQTRGNERPSERPTATVVTFPATGRRFRRFRRQDADAPRGAILFFTGIRYERMPETDVAPPRLRRRS